MTSRIIQDAAHAQVADQARRAARRSVARAASATPAGAQARGDSTVVVRRATAADDATIAMLAALDSAA